MAAHEDGSPGPDDRIELSVRDGVFFPDNNKVSRFITSRFALETCDTGYSWKYVTPEQRQWYWDEFIKKYRWDASIDVAVRDLWFKSCATLYRRTIHDWRTRDSHPHTVTTKRWALWKAAWEDDRWKERASKNKANRASEPAGPGTGTTKHIAGAKTYSAHIQDLRARHGRDPTSWEVYIHTHRNDDGSFVDERSRLVNEAMERYMAESMDPSTEGDEPVVPSPESVNNIFKTVVGGKKKGRMYGCGSMASIYYPHDMAPSQRGMSSGVDRSSQEMEEMRDRLDASIRSNEELRASVQRTEEENATLKSQMEAHVSRVEALEVQAGRVASLEEQVRLLVAGMSQGSPIHPHGRSLYRRGASSRGRPVPGPSHVGSLRPYASKRDYGSDDEADDDDDNYDDEA